MSYHVRSICFFISIIILSYTSPGRASIPKETLNQLKDATVFIVLEEGEQVKSGSGFLIQKNEKAGFIITNAHVISSYNQKGKVSVVLNSGTTRMKVLETKIVGLNIDADLALLQVNSSTLPEPIHLGTELDIEETDEVYILGFPFGTMLSTNRTTPTITISKGMVSSKRKDENDQTFLFQIDGDINHGNSGGPIVTADGELIGVSVSTIKETNIGFAIPSYKVRTMLRGALTNFIVIKGSGKAGELTLKANLIDPLNQVNSASLLIIEEKKADSTIALQNDGNWSPITEKKGFLFNRKHSQQMVVSVTPEKNNTLSYLAQARITMEDGEVFYQAPFAIIFQNIVAKMLTSTNKNVLLGGPGTLKSEQEPETVKRKSPPKGSMHIGPGQLRSEPIEPLIVQKDDSIKIITDSPIEDVIVGGGGKYLIFKFTGEPQLGIFEVATNEWYQNVTVDDFDFSMAANRDSLFIGYSAVGRLEKFTLQPFKSVLTVDSPNNAPIKSMVAGYNSTATPLLVKTGQEITFFDPRTLNHLEIEWSPRPPHMYSDESVFRASAEGNSFTYWATKISPAGINLFRLEGSTVYVLREHDTAGYLAPSFDGNYVFTNFHGIYNSQLKQVGSQKLRRQHIIPGLGGKYFLKVNYEDKKVPLSIHSLKTHRSVHIVPSLKEMKNDLHPYSFHSPPLTEEKRLLFFPAQQKLITIPFSNDRIVVRHINFNS
ncbi:MAG: serine protease [Desulfobulbaceae bacterium]|nr:serine protease [Desulfobulbaceae bacterium]